MHDGRFTTLAQVVQHYSTGIQQSATLDPGLAREQGGGVQLSDSDQAALVAFLETLTEPQFIPHGHNQP
jgi:cytochrome c peroxidase